MDTDRAGRNDALLQSILATLARRVRAIDARIADLDAALPGLRTRRERAVEPERAAIDADLADAELERELAWADRERLIAWGRVVTSARHAPQPAENRAYDEGDAR